MFRFLQIKLEKKQLGSEESVISVQSRRVSGLAGWLLMGRNGVQQWQNIPSLSPQVSRAQLVQDAYLHCEVPVNQAREQPGFS